MVYAVMFDIGNTIMTFGVVYPIGSYFSSNHKGLPAFGSLIKKVFSLPPVLGLFIGLIINVSNVEMPTLFFDFLGTLAQANNSRLWKYAILLVLIFMLGEALIIRFL